MSNLPARHTLKGEVLPRVVITVRQVDDGPWRVFSTDSRDRFPLSHEGRMLGGTWDQAVSDAESLRASHGFEFERPSGLWLPSRTL